jgi:alkylhydroperoxidase family enzyme
MIRSLARRWLRRFSQRYYYDTGYMEAMLQQDPTLFLKFASLTLLSSHRRGIPRAPLWTARIRAALWEDCGPCVQLVCNMAIEDGIDPAVVAAVVAAEGATLDEDCALALQFTESVLARDPGAEQLRERVRLAWGEDGILSLAMGISISRVYPTVKYVLGHGRACSRVHIEQRKVAPLAFASATIARTTNGGISP